MNYLRGLSRPFFVLAPMDDVTDTVFRQIVSSCARPDLFFTEFVNVDGLQSPGRPKLIKRLLFSADDQPLIAQLWGKQPINFYKTARQIADGSLSQELGLPKGYNFAGIDINMGCPDKTITKNGCCAALINNRDLAVEIIKATKQGAQGKLPVSVKTRLGWNEIDLSWPELLLNQGLDMLTIHGRTKRQMSDVPADWAAIEAIRKLRDKINPQTLIVGNGDVQNLAQGRVLAEKYKLDGIMIGRGIFNDPFVFADTSPWADYSPQQKMELYARHISLFAKTWQADQRPVVTLNKFCKVYINGFNGAKDLREQLMSSKSTEALLERLGSNFLEKMVGAVGVEPTT